MQTYRLVGEMQFSLVPRSLFKSLLPRLPKTQLRCHANGRTEVLRTGPDLNSMGFSSSKPEATGLCLIHPEPR